MNVIKMWIFNLMSKLPKLIKELQIITKTTFQIVVTEKQKTRNWSFFFQIKLINSKMLPYKQIEFKIKDHAI